MPTTKPPRKKLKSTKEVSHCPCCPKFEEWRQTKTEVFTMPAGEYYCGDLSWVLRPALDQEVEFEDGKFELSDGRVVGCFRYDGCQDNDKGRDDVYFHVNGDMIGITLLAGLEEQWVDPKAWRLNPDAVSSGINVKAISTSGKKITMMDYIKNAGTTVVYDTDFECTTDTMSHYKHDEHVTSISFGDKICIGTYHGNWSSDDES